MKKNKTMPLLLIEEYTQKFPSCWDQIEDFRSVKGTELPDWPDFCYIPIAGTLAVVTEGMNLGEYQINQEKVLQNHIPIKAATLAALAPWRRHKEIYSFSKELEELLLEQADEQIKLPVQTLHLLPFPCVYIELKTIPDLDGFFVHFEYDMNVQREEFRFLLIDKTGVPYPWMLHIDGEWTLDESLERVMQESQKNILSLKDIEQFRKEKEFIQSIGKELLAGLLQLVLYLCCQNAEIKENAIQKQIYKRPEKRIQDKYREIRKWDVGEEISRKIKASRLVRNHAEQERKKESSQQRNRPRPHTRRGHWHHFWTGKRGSDMRKLTLKWIAPTYVNLVNEDELRVRRTEFDENE